MKIDREEGLGVLTFHLNTKKLNQDLRLQKMGMRLKEKNLPIFSGSSGPLKDAPVDLVVCGVGSSHFVIIGVFSLWLVGFSFFSFHSFISFFSLSLYFIWVSSLFGEIKK